MVSTRELHLISCAKCKEMKGLQSRISKLTSNEFSAVKCDYSAHILSFEIEYILVS